jgi:UDP-glucose 4-epimerase
MRVLITGCGGELGTRLANLLEADPTVTDLMGFDLYPPRRRIYRVAFHRVDPRDRRKTVRLVREFDPEIVLHAGVYEPNARTDPTTARLSTAAGAVSVLGAATSCPSLQGIVVLSRIEIYGRRRGSATRPDESVEIDPTTPFGLSLAHMEQVANEAGQVAGVPVTALRFGPVLGPNYPSPLGRYLRQQVVPVNPFSELPFCLVHQEDAAHSLVKATRLGYDGPLNVVGPGAVTASQAVRMGGHIPLPVMGPGWPIAGFTSGMLGAPLPAHTRELLTRGCMADGSLGREILGFEPRPTPDVVTQLHRWSEVAHVATTEARPA